jgi:parallel beta-helix repeat protein
MLVGAPVTQAAAAQRMLVVDDDRQQCSNADYTSINAAVAAASPGDTIRVCPGLYSETVVVNKASLSLRGFTNGSSTQPCLRGDAAANPTVDSVISGGVRLEANRVSLEGFTVQGRPPDPLLLSSGGIATSAAFSGYSIRLNVVQDNPDGINLNSSGASTTVVDHNCIRRNNLGGEGETGIFAEQGLLTNARIEANTFTGHAFSSMFLGYGLAAFPVITAPNRDLVVTGNLSVDDGIGGIIVSNVKRVAISNNKLIRTGNAIAVYTPASEVLVARNQVEDSPFFGIRVDGNPFGCCSYPTGPTSIAVAANTVRRAGTAAPQDGILLNRTSHSSVVDNRIEGSNRDGIDVRDSTEILVVANQADSNARDGIRNRGTSASNTFKDNHMHGNTEHDAHDENRTLNTWTDNICQTDFPAGTICRP